MEEIYVRKGLHLPELTERLHLRTHLSHVQCEQIRALFRLQNKSPAARELTAFFSSSS